MPAARVPFVGRREEMAVHEDEFARAAAGGFRVLLARAGLHRPQVTVEVVDGFERPGGPAKLKRFLPLESAPVPLNSGR
jgi:hypothetical protein